MTTNRKTIRPVAGWTKQVLSFGTSFAFFGLAGLLQSHAQLDAQAAELEQQQALATVQVTPEPVAQAKEDVLLGPVQPIAEVAVAPVESVTVEPAPVATAPAPAPAPAPAQVATDGHTSGS